VTDIVNVIQQTYFDGILQMGAKDQSLIDMFNPGNHCPHRDGYPQSSVGHCTGEFIVPWQFGPAGGAQRKCETRIINHMVKNACTEGLYGRNADFCSSSKNIQSKQTHAIHTMLCKGSKQLVKTQQ
jgi:hypothetical protein